MAQLDDNEINATPVEKLRDLIVLLDVQAKEAVGKFRDLVIRVRDTICVLALTLKSDVDETGLKDYVQSAINAHRRLKKIIPELSNLWLSHIYFAYKLLVWKLSRFS